MPDNFTIDVETRALLAALDAAPAAILRFTKPAARLTAERIRDDARQRVARRTGRTATGITIEETYDGTGYIVSPFNESHRSALSASGNEQQARNLPLWLEVGTIHMTQRPYFWIAGALEQNAHDRRMRDAIQEGIDATGLGD